MLFVHLLTKRPLHPPHIIYTLHMVLALTSRPNHLTCEQDARAIQEHLLRIPRADAVLQRTLILHIHSLRWVGFLLRYVCFHKNTMRCLDAVLSLDGTLDKKDTRKRTMFFVLNVAVLLMTLGTLEVWFNLQGRYLYCTTVLFVICAAIYATILVLCKVKLTTPAIVFIAYIYVLGTFSADITARATGNNSWPLLVLVVDFLLVMEVPTCYSMGVVCCHTSVFGCHVCSKDCLQVWYSRHSLASNHRSLDAQPTWMKPYQLHRAPLPRQSTCHLSSRSTAGAVYLVIDFIATRGFARGLLKEQASMERTIDAVQEIAALLAGYDVEQVAELLKTHEGELPEGMTAALRGLGEEPAEVPSVPPLLRCLRWEADGVQQPTVAPPGLDSETATIVFTDIRASTSIWAERT